MLYPDYFDNINDKPFKRYEKLEEKTLRLIAKKIKSILNGDDVYLSPAELEFIYKEIELIGDDVTEIVTQSGVDSYKNDVAIYQKGDKELKPFNENTLAKLAVLSAAEMVRENFKNSNVGIADTPINEYYNKIVTNVRNNKDIASPIINELSTKGLQFIGGNNVSMEVGIRRTITNSINKLSASLSLQNASDMRQDLMELTAHTGARPSHADWQGQIVSLSGRDGYLTLQDIGYGDVTGFLGINCRHNWYPFFEGISIRNYTNEELRNIDPKPFYDNDRFWTIYEATQRQRYIERNIRNAKRKIIVFDELEDERATRERIKLQRYRKEYRRFSNKAGLKLRYDNLYVA